MQALSIWPSYFRTRSWVKILPQYTTSLPSNERGYISHRYFPKIHGSSYRTYPQDVEWVDNVQYSGIPLYARRLWGNLVFTYNKAQRLFGIAG
jgi:hypothetical protein